LDVIDAKDQGIKANDVHRYHSIEISIRKQAPRARQARQRCMKSGGGVGEKSDCGEDCRAVWQLTNRKWGCDLSANAIPERAGYRLTGGVDGTMN
jgi:hypothetical protein